MSLKFRKGKDTGKEAHRILRLETEKALVHLDQFEQDQAKHIHQARRSFRRIRSLLRLVRPIHPYVYAVENQFYARLGRSLSAARDRDAVLGIADYLEDCQEIGSRSESRFLLRRLITDATRRKACFDPVKLQHQVFTATKEILAAQGRYRDLTFRGLPPKKLRKSVDRTLRHMLQSYRRAAASGSEEDFHELRKHARYGFNQMVMCAPLEPAFTPGLRTQMKRLAGVLGRHQDLCVLHGFVSGQYHTLQIDDPLLRLSSLIESKKQELRQQALEQVPGIMDGFAERGPALRPAAWPENARKHRLYVLGLKSAN